MVRTAIVPAAGRGERLDRPGTPKPIVEVGGVPLVVGVLQQLAEAGVERAVVVLGYGADLVTAKLRAESIPGLEVVCVENERWEQGLARSLLAAQEAVGDTSFLIAMADHVLSFPMLARVRETTPPSRGVAALVDDEPEGVFDLAAAVKVATAGELVLDVARDLADFDAVDAGVLHATPALFDALRQAAEADPDADLSDALSILAREGRVHAVRTGGLPWDDVDTPAGLVHAELRLRRMRRRERAVGAATTGAAATRADRYRFTTGAPVDTQILVGRGLLEGPEQLPIALIPEESATSPVFVFTDETVGRLHGERFIGKLRRAGYDVHAVVVADGEESKTLSNYVYLTERVLARGIDERSILISLGGGAVCNVCGMVASTLYRGIGLVQVPTTLMAQCDAAISHKQAVNGAHGKNLVGAYYAPRLIVADIDVLATLEDWRIPDGLAEVVKHALGQDREYADLLLGYEGSLRDPDFLELVVRRNVALKSTLMAEDPTELAAGMVLQYGHTVGHPVEFLSGYALSHGQAVAIGMVVAARVARLLGACDDELVALHERLIRRYELPTAIPRSMRIPDILDAMRYNKRHLTEGARMALLRGLGELWCVDGEYAIPVAEDVLVGALESSMEGRLPPRTGHVASSASERAEGGSR